MRINEKLRIFLEEEGALDDFIENMLPIDTPENYEVSSIGAFVWNRSVNRPAHDWARLYTTYVNLRMDIPPVVSATVRPPPQRKLI